MTKSMFIRPKMLGKLLWILWLGSVYELSFEWQRQAVTLSWRTSVVINNEPVQVDPQLMSQRLRFIATRETHENPTLPFKCQDFRPEWYREWYSCRGLAVVAVEYRLWGLSMSCAAIPCLVWHIISPKGCQQVCPCRWNLGSCEARENCSFH